MPLTPPPKAEDLPELLPCPFCGHRGQWQENYGTCDDFIQCEFCDAATAEFSVAASAAAAWNRRTPAAASGGGGRKEGGADAEGGWVIARDRLPPSGMRCLVALADTDRVDIAERRGETWGHDNWHRDVPIHHADHWWSLPSPPSAASLPLHSAGGGEEREKAKS